MSAGYLLVLSICIAIASTSFARILHVHDNNLLDVQKESSNETKRLQNYIPIPPKKPFRNDTDVFANIDEISIVNLEKISFIKPSDSKIQKKKPKKKKLWKSVKSFAKRNMKTETKDLRNTLYETLKMPEEPSSKISTPAKFQNDRSQFRRIVSTPKPLIGTSNSADNKLISESSEFADEATEVSFESSMEASVSSKEKITGELEYYKGVPTMGQKLSGPSIEEVMLKFGEHNDELRNENMWTGYTRISNSSIQSEEFVPSHRSVKERIALLANPNDNMIINESEDQ